MLKPGELGGLNKKKWQLVCDSLFLKDAVGSEQFAVLAALLG